MASFLSSTLFLALIISAVAAQNGLILPIRKDPKTLQHIATFKMGSNRAAISAAVDLGGPFLWFSCNDYASTTYAPIPCGSAKCDAAKGIGCVGCNLPPRPGCTNDTCGASPYNPFLDVLVSQGYAEDTFYAKSGAPLPEYSFSCMDKDYLTGLAAGATGMLGLGRTQISLHRQASAKLNLPDAFSLCLPSSGAGKLEIGIKPRSVKTTPLLINPVSTYPIYTEGDASDEYFIDVRGIAVAGARLNLKDSYFSIDKNGVGGTKISTMQNFTAVHNSIYKPLARAFAKAASDLGIRSAAAVAPFRACFSSSSIARTAAGPAVPEIELVLAGKDATWRMRGANLMVEIDRKTTCLGFVDGGSSPRTAVVIGAHQLEENLLEFDLVSSQLRFSESLLLSNTSCSRI
ncbi:probable aspartic proteinase GIP2 [Salvia miltiorrhiza]|uniref:probable aspartic proteinase GIP2 n=1 Tax=Salvia miltiorrhiza TaxID=226208 RepID=UPI0025AB9F7C|nr:probable aspartic proteinase GIP2 [Salvia miltiorrhiza]